MWSLFNSILLLSNLFINTLIQVYFPVGYDSLHMKLDGKFSYLKENQRTLSFNVDIVKLPKHRTVFAGSSSKRGGVLLNCNPDITRQLQRLRVWDPPVSLAWTFHPLHLSPVSNVCHDELGFFLCSSGKIRQDGKTN